MIFIYGRKGWIALTVVVEGVARRCTEEEKTFVLVEASRYASMQLSQVVKQLTA